MIGLGSSNLGIGIAIHLRNHFSKEANTVTGSMRKLSGEARAMMRDNLTSMRNMGAGVAFTGLLMAAGINSAIKQASVFDDKMKAVSANSMIVGTELKALSQDALKLSRVFPYTAVEIADSLKDISKAVDVSKMGRKELMRLSKDALLLGTVGETDVGGERGSAEILINIMSQFNLEARKSREVVDKLAMTANKTTTDVKTLAESFKYGGSEAKRLGLDLDNTLALFGMLGQAGLKGSLGGTTAGNFLRYLTKAVGEFKTRRQSHGLAMIGLRAEDIMDSQGNLKDLSTVLTRIKTQVSGMNNIAKQNAMEAIFGVRGSRAEAVLTMLDKSNFGSSFKELLKSLQNSKGYAMAQMAIRMESYQKRVKLLNNAIFEFKYAMSEAFVPVLIPAINVITKLIHVMVAFAKTPVGKFTFIMAGVLIALSTMGGLLAMLTGGLGSLLLASRSTFSGMAAAAKWAYAQMGLAALNFGRVSAGVTWNESLGRWTAASRGGRMIPKGLAERYNRRFGGKMGMLSSILSFLPFEKFTSFGRIIGKILPVLRGFSTMLLRIIPLGLRFIPYVGVVITVLSLFMDLRDILKGLLWVIATAINAIYTFNPLTMLYKLFTTGNPFDGFMDRQRNINSKASDIKFKSGTSKPRELYNQYTEKGFSDKLKADNEKTFARINQQNTVIVKLDGNTIQKVVENKEEDLLLSGLPIK